MRYQKLTRVPIKGHPVLNERWVQDRIAEDPSILGLGDLILKDKERIQSGAGRLDLLLQEADGNRRFEVEIQLGKTDESHIIRTIEYWDLEKKRYPQYDHAAVIVAEEITSRFLNVVSLFNGHIPLIALQMRALALDDVISLDFAKVLDEVRLGLVDEDEEAREVTDRAYWEARSSRAILAIADEALEVLRTINSKVELKYNKYYVGISLDGRATNFVVFLPRKNALRIQPRLPRTPETDALLEGAGVVGWDYDNPWGRYRIPVQKGEVQKHGALFGQLFRAAYKDAGLESD